MINSAFYPLRDGKMSIEEKLRIPEHTTWAYKQDME